MNNLSGLQHLVTPQTAADELLKRRRARQAIEHFTRYTKPDYESNWHHKVLCEYLDRFVNRQIPRLMVFMPPRHGKSELVSRRLPAYILGRNPDARLIACSYSADLSSRMNRDVQRIIDDPSYARLFPDTTLFGKNIRTVAGGSWLRNSDLFEVVGHAGTYRSAGVGGGITGMGYDYGIIDDPIKNQEEADSKTIREGVFEWYTSTFYTRREKNASILITMTRWHEDDLAGRLLKQMQEEHGAEQWTVIKFPARAESTPAFMEDRRAENDPLWPDKYNDDDLSKTQVAVGTRAWGALYQQNPRPLEGKIVDPDKLIRLLPENVPPLIAVVRRWDLAFSEKSGADYVTGCKMGLTADGRRIILHMKRLRGRWTTSKPVILQIAKDDGLMTHVLIEANGTQLGYYQDVKDDPAMFNFVVLPDKPEGTKEMRASVWGSRLIDGIVYVVVGEWNQALFDEMDSFPNGEHDDQVDAISGAWARLSTHGVQIFL